VAIYIGVLRHALALPPGSDALFELEMRLTPADRSQRPPTRAPGISRLRTALRAMRRGLAPAGSIEDFRADLAFLRNFDQDTSWGAAALDALLGDVTAAPAPRETHAKRTSDNPKVVPLQRRKPARAEDA
jgi:hypothetical protein